MTFFSMGPLLKLFSQREQVINGGQHGSSRSRKVIGGRREMRVLPLGVISFDGFRRIIKKICRKFGNHRISRI